jgi:photosystem II stability/assembly factor-like uncharacterized protein
MPSGSISLAVFTVPSVYYPTVENDLLDPNIFTEKKYRKGNSMKILSNLKIVILLSVFFSPSLNSQWIKMGTTFAPTIGTFTVMDTTLFAGSQGGGIVRTENNGTTVNWSNNGLLDGNVTSLATVGTRVIAGTNTGVFVSDNGGKMPWVASNNGLTSLAIFDLTVNNGVILAATGTGGVFRSTNNGDSWTASNDGNPHIYTWSIKTLGSTVFLGLQQAGVYKSVDNGLHWTAANTGLNVNAYGFAFGSNGSTYFVGTNEGIYRTTNNGDAWIQVNTGLVGLTGGGAIRNIFGFASNGSDIYAATITGLYRSTNNGDNWNKVNIGSSSDIVTAVTFNGTTLIAAGIDSEVFTSSDNGATWTPVRNTFLGVYGHALAATSERLSIGTPAGHFTSTDGGATMSFESEGMSGRAVQGLFIFAGSWLYCGASGGGLSRSGIDGKSWAKVEGLTSSVNSITSQGSYLFAGTGNGVWRSPNNTMNWTQMSETFGGNGIQTIAPYSTALFAGTRNAVYRSTNSGENWVKRDSGLSGLEHVHRFLSAGTSVFMCASTGVYRSLDNGDIWETVTNGLEIPMGYDLVRYTPTGGVTHLFVSSYGTVYRSVNNGNTWSNVTTDIVQPDLFRLAIGGSYLYASSFSGAIYRRPLADLVVSVETEKTVPGQFFLEQNYPNPFNPATTIHYTLPRSAHVKLTIHDVLGREIAALVNEEQSAGWKQVQWNAHIVPSGIYFYRIQSGNFVDCKKMILMK